MHNIFSGKRLTSINLLKLSSILFTKSKYGSYESLTYSKINSSFRNQLLWTRIEKKLFTLLHHNKISFSSKNIELLKIIIVWHILTHLTHSLTMISLNILQMCSIYHDVFFYSENRFHKCLSTHWWIELFQRYINPSRTQWYFLIFGQHAWYRLMRWNLFLNVLAVFQCNEKCMNLNKNNDIVFAT